MPVRPTVFISYAHESDDHAARVLAFADQLVADGIDVLLDQYDPNPAEGWPVWMQLGLDRADFVLMVCSPAYQRRVMRQEAAGPSTHAPRGSPSHGKFSIMTRS
ncbi:MAG: toll/interleukin-1 receptor domain-containing protein [Capsulimonadaceae bacterium]